MKKLEAMIRAVDLDDLKDALAGQGVRTIVAVDVVCLGPSIQQRVVYRGSSSITDSAPCIKLEVVVPDERLERAIATLTSAVERSPAPEFGILVATVQHLPVERLEPVPRPPGTAERVEATRDAEKPRAPNTATAVVEWVHGVLPPASSPSY